MIPHSFLLQLVEHLIVLKFIMEKLDVGYSLKNFPIPYNEPYIIKLIEKIESVEKRTRRRAHILLQEKHESDIQREGFEFKSTNTPLQYKHIEAFEKEFLDMILNIKFQSVKNTIQKKLEEGVSSKTGNCS